MITVGKIFVLLQDISTATVMEGAVFWAVSLML